MYEAIEHWKQYKQEKALQAKIAKELKLKEAMKEMDIFLAKLRKKNGQTKYQIMSKECKQARNIIGGSMLLMIVLIAIISMSSCGSVNTCAAYVSVEKLNSYE